MNLQINKTPDSTKTYPIHSHSNYEIMLYLEGSGNLLTDDAPYPFSPGSIIIVPPHTLHGSNSADNFCNISIGGDFGHILSVSKVTAVSDSALGEGAAIARLIYENRFSEGEYLEALVSSFLLFVASKQKSPDKLHEAVGKIAEEITKSAFSHDFTPTPCLSKYGFAEDYIRSKFTKITGRTPTEYLRQIRIKRACFLIDIYRDTLTLSEIAEMCGFLDYVYFSRIFKEYTGVSPREYKKMQN